MPKPPYTLFAIRDFSDLNKQKTFSLYEGPGPHILASLSGSSTYHLKLSRNSVVCTGTGPLPRRVYGKPLVPRLWKNRTVEYLVSHKYDAVVRV